MPDDNLPAIPDDGEIVEGEIVEGEIVDEPQRPPVIVLRPVIQAARVVVVVVRHEHTQAVVRQGGYVRQGVIAALRHLRDSRTTAPHQRMFRTAESAGDHEMALKWMDLAEKRMEGRHKRRMERRQPLRDSARTLHWYRLAGSSACCWCSASCWQLAGASSAPSPCRSRLPAA